MVQETDLSANDYMGETRVRFGYLLTMRRPVAGVPRQIEVIQLDTPQVNIPILHWVTFTNSSSAIDYVIIDGEPWFIAATIAKMLEYRMASDMTRFLEDYEKGTHIVRTGRGLQNLTVINESGLYSAIMKSRKPEAKEFKRWVTSEVLPSIRQHGGYIAGQEVAESPEVIMARALQVANSVIARHQQQLASQAPKVEFFDQVANSSDAIDIGEAANVLNIQGYGRNNLFRFLREQRILKPDNHPYQEYINRGYFRVIEQKINKPGGDVGIGFKTVVYQRGLDFIRKRLNANKCEA